MFSYLIAIGIIVTVVAWYKWRNVQYMDGQRCQMAKRTLLALVTACSALDCLTITLGSELNYRSNFPTSTWIAKRAVVAVRSTSLMLRSG